MASSADLAPAATLSARALGEPQVFAVRRQLQQQQRTRFRRRAYLGLVLALAGIGGIAWRWHHLQISQFEHFAELSSDNQIALQPVGPARGQIFDRRGQPLAENLVRLEVLIASDQAHAILPKLDLLRRYLDISADTEAKLRKAASSNVYLGEILLKEHMTEDEVIRFIAIQQDFPEIVLDAKMMRYYPNTDEAAHVIGHVARITPEDKQRLRRRGRSSEYRGTEFIGKRGLEANYETRLQGRPGLRHVQVDAHGRVLNAIQRLAPMSGQDLWLTIDQQLQRTAEKLLAGRAGAVVAMNPHDGTILALATAPRFDINEFVGGISQKQWGKLNDEAAGTPMVHRAIYGQYAPGSTIKPFLALAALSRGWRDENYVFHSTGVFELVPGVYFHDWKASGHGDVDISKSIIRSVNSFYYQLAADVGVDELSAGLRVFGFGEPSTIDIGGERPGVLPTEAWKLAKYNERWYPGDTIPIGVGQGYLEVTPLQLARAMAVIANGGHLVTPRLVARAGVDRVLPQQPGPVLFEPDHLRLIQAALAKVTQSGGTAYSRVGKDSIYPIAGKTGTSQVTRLRYRDGRRIKNEDLPEHLRDHAWFVGFAPAYNPTIVVAVLIEHGGSGGRAAGPVARAVMDEYLLRIRGRLFGPPADQPQQLLAHENLEIR